MDDKCKKKRQCQIYRVCKEVVVSVNKVSCKPEKKCAEKKCPSPCNRGPTEEIVYANPQQYANQGIIVPYTGG